MDKKVYPIITFLLILAGCAMPQTQAEKGTAALQAFQVSAVATADIADDLCTQGLLNQPECDELRKLYLKTASSWVAAKNSYVFWLDNQTSTAWDTYLLLRERFIGNYETFDAKAERLGVLEFTR